MQTTGIVRKIDELGRIVLPKELRKCLNIKTGDDFQISLDSERIILERYSLLCGKEEEIIKLIECFKNTYSFDILLIVNNKIVNYNNLGVSDVISNLISERKIYINNVNDRNIISDELILSGKMVLNPIVMNSDLLGSIMIVSDSDINNMIDVSKVIVNLIKMKYKNN